MKRIAVFHPEGNIDSNPNLSGFCNELALNGYEVDVWSVAHPGFSFSFEENCNIHRYFTSDYNDIDPAISNYCFILGIDNGIVPAARLAQVLSVPFGFLSYELIFDEEIKGRLAKKQKNAEKEACRLAAFVIVQDKQRSKCLQAEYGIPEEKILLMPVAGKGIVAHKQSFFLHDHLQIPHETSILLHIGSVAEWTMTDWAVKNIESLPAGWKLVIHSRTGSNNMAFIHENVMHSNLPSLPFSKMNDLLQSATYTLALYKPVAGNHYTGKNLENIGLASGKISTSLQYGIPVITNQIGEISTLIEEYKAGLILDTASATPFSILENIKPDADAAANCYRLFSEKLDMGVFSDTILEKIRTLTEPQGLTVLNLNKLPGQHQKIKQHYDKLTLKNQVKMLFVLALRTVKSILG